LKMFAANARRCIGERLHFVFKINEASKSAETMRALRVLANVVLSTEMENCALFVSGGF
jgi:hypothetical protein